MIDREDLEAGVSLGDFRIEERIGAGGMGVVYRARQISLNRPVALKVLGSALTRPQDIARFQREAQAAARLKHPAIAAIHYVGQDRRCCYMALEYIDGPSVQELIDRIRSGQASDLMSVSGTAETVAPEVRFDAPTAPAALANAAANTGAPILESALEAITRPAYWRKAVELVRDVARALAYAHSQGVIHRDIKPANLLVDGSGKPFVIDFGIARFFDDQTLTQTGALVGTPLYMSPEQVASRTGIDHRTDIYSLGAVLYELLTLQPPFPVGPREALLRQILTKAVVPASWLNSSIPADLEAIVHKAMQKDLDDRYASANDFADDVDRLVVGQTVTAPAYRYRFDPREIAAERPVGITALALFWFTVGAIAFLLGATGFAAPCYAVVGVGCIATAIGVYAGRLWGQWLCVILGGYLLNFAFNWMMDLMGGWILARPDVYDKVLNLLIVGVEGLFGGLSIAYMLRPSTAAWFDRARTLRADFRRRRSHSRVTRLHRSS